MMYRYIIKPILFLFDAETVHNYIVKILIFCTQYKVIRILFNALFNLNDKRLEVDIAGLKFKNPVGLAAGFDKDALLHPNWDCFGFGFAEMGTLTPKPQSGNPRPRLFRLKKDNALLNRMGFNNHGVDHAIQKLSTKKSGIPIGGNIGKNKDTPNETALEDYLFCLEKLYPYVDYFVINVSSPNTPGLRALQEKEPLKNILLQLVHKRNALGKHKPIFLKIAPDLNDSQLKDVVEIIRVSGIEGVVATNTTISKEDLITEKAILESYGTGGISGAPVFQRSNEIIRFLRKELGPDFPIIGVGGIMHPKDAIEKVKAGANLIQIYSGWIFQGPFFVRKINRALLKRSFQASE